MINRRKVQLTGTSTLTVSIPREWARRNGVSQGSELYFSEAEDGSLIVCTREEQKKREIVLNVDSFDNGEELQRAFLAKYLAGFDSIKFTSKERIQGEKRKVIVSEARRLIGLEVTDEDTHSLTVQSFFSSEGLSIEKTVRRAHIITQSLQEDAALSIEEKDPDLAKSVMARDDEVDRLRFLVMRQLNLALTNSSMLRALGLRAMDCFYYHALIRLVENIADDASLVAKHSVYFAGAKIPQSSLKKIVELSNLARGIEDKAFKAFSARDLKNANKVIMEEEEFALLCSNQEKELTKANAPFHIGVVLDRTASIASNGAEIAELVIDRGEG